MRFIVAEQGYETAVAAGQLRYQQNGRATGAVEWWRLTAVADEYQIVRVDLDARQAPSGHSYLYHLLRGPHGRPDRLDYRFWQEGLLLAGRLLFTDTAVINRRTINGRTYEEELPWMADRPFWFPATVGLGLLFPFVSGTAVTLAGPTDQEATFFQLQTFDIAIDQPEPDVYHIAWGTNERTLWLDSHRWPIKMVRDNGLTAVENRAIWYRS